MRLLLGFLLLGLVAACAGDSSSLMSSWNDQETGGSSGGSGGGWGGSGGGPVPYGQGGSGGFVTIPLATGGSGGSIDVRGGVRDRTTAQCTRTSSGGGCPISPALLGCLEGYCHSYLTACFQGTTGPCGDYAVCMFACPCDSGRTACETACLNDKGMGSEACGPRLNAFMSCWTNSGCGLPTCSTY